MQKAIFNATRVTAEISHKKYLKEISWTIRPGEFWAVLGTNASGKSGLGQLLSGRLKVLSGEITFNPGKTGYVSFEKHAEIMENLIKNDETDFIDCIDTGTQVKEFICNINSSSLKKNCYQKDKTSSHHLPDSDKANCLQKRVVNLAKQFCIDHLLEQGIRFLSTGEIRKVMICQALAHDPELLVLDEPYDGVDALSRKAVADAVVSLAKQGITVVMILNRFSEIPEEATHILYISDCMIQLKGARKDILKEYGHRKTDSASAGENTNKAVYTLEKLHNLHYTLPAVLPEKYTLPGNTTTLSPSLSTKFAPSFSTHQFQDNSVLVKMVDTTVVYEEKTVLDRISWEVKKGEHWKISGPNGAGKSTLLSLVNGDNPQAYCNHIELFGIRRGSGESIWDIKRHTGIVSSRFQLDYRVSSNVLGVVVSGFFDSIGVYSSPSEKQKQIAMEWLGIIGMDSHAKKSFRTLSYGEQRMVLIARAMIKHPPLLILDEPCQGLDEINRNMVLKLIDHIGKKGESTLLYVTHHEEDYIDCITHNFQFVPKSSGGMSVVIS